LSGGLFHLHNYFQPFDYITQDSHDQDLGSGGVCLLDPTVFKTSGVTRMAAVTGKPHKIYVVNADNLGGFKEGSGKTDKVLQEVPLPGETLGGMGSYPLDGGYI
jgi:iron transport multicopper oxidase